MNAILLTLLILSVFICKLTRADDEDEEFDPDEDQTNPDELEENTADTDYCERAQKQGFFCVDCRTPVHCMKDGEKFKTYLSSSCENNEENKFCNLETKGCSKKPSLSCDENIDIKGFKCGSKGIYPDPDNCKNFHICKNDVEEPCTSSCDVGEFFSIAVKGCVTGAAPSNCNERKYNCSDGDEGLWPMWPNIHYLCLDVYDSVADMNFARAYWFQCEHGEIYDLESSSCLNGQNSGEPKPNSNDPTIALPTSTSKAGCQKEGLSADINDPRSYYYCSSHGQQLRYQCPSRTRFDDNTKSCILDSRAYKFT